MIDEKKLIEDINEEFCADCSECFGHCEIRLLEKLIERQQKIGGWIPCSKELPSSDGKFEVTIKGSRGKRHVEMCNYYKDAKVVFGNEKWGGENVIAWRQRSEPYKGE